MTYLKKQEAANFHMNDLVLVTRTAYAGERGWENSWSENMDDSVNHVFIIEREPALSSGIYLNSGYAYPYFILKKVEDIKLLNIKIGTVLTKKEHPNWFCIVEKIYDDKNVRCRTASPNRAEHSEWNTSLYELSFGYEVVL